MHCVVSNFTTSNTLGHLPYPSRARNSTRFHCVRGCLRVSAQNHQKITHGVDLVPLHWATSWTEPPFSSSSISLPSRPGPSLPQEVQQVTQSLDRSMVKTLVLQQAQNSCSFRLLYLSNRLPLPTILSRPSIYLSRPPAGFDHLLRPKLPSDAATLHAPAGVI